MKNTIVAVLSVCVIAAGATSAQAYDWNSKASFNAEWKQQEARILAGRRSGSLSRMEARMLMRDHNKLAGLPYTAITKSKLSRESKRIASYKQP